MAAEGLLSLIYPQIRCVCCRAEDDLCETGLCRECRDGLSGLAGMARHDGVFFGYDYAGHAKSLVLGLKFGNVRGAALPLARQMAGGAGVPGFDAYDALIAVPISKRRMRERGYNQSAVLCGLVSRMVGLPVCAPGRLRRIRHTAAQTGLSVAQRHANVSRAFSADGVRGLRLLLVDDVYTTGATTGECKRTLMSAGAGCVDVLCATLARLADHTADN